MAEYYPLLERAVAGVRNASAEQRRAIYDRARDALLGQLRSMQPPVPEASIDRESAALDEAIARVEASLLERLREAETAPPDSSSAPPDASAPPPATSLPAAAVNEPATTPAPPVLAPPIVAPRAAPAPRVTPTPPPVITPPIVPPAAMPLRAAPARPAAEALSRIVAERGPVAPVIRASRQPEAAAGPAVLPLPSAPRLEMPTFADAMTTAAERTRATGLGEDDEAEGVEGIREEPLRPLAPRPSSGERFNGRALILAAVGIAVIAVIAYAAWRLRDRPEALARSQAAMLAAKQADQQSTAKVSTRADNSTAGVPAPTPAAGAPAPAAAVPAPTAAAAPTPDAPAAAAAPQPPAAAPVAPIAQNAPPVATPSPAPATPAPAPATPAISVAQRAAFLVDAPDDPAKVKTYVGTVVWTTDNVSSAQNQPISRAVRAQIDVPEAGLGLTMTFQKNFEAQFPASHTLELRFTLQPSNTLGAIKQINMPQMRKDEAPAGDALIGLPVTITDNYFLVGLSRGDPTQVNLDLIKSRNWFDIPILLTSGKVAKITFEKGTTGQQAIDDVLQSWQ